MEVPHSTFILYLLTVLQLRESGEILTGFKLGIRSDWFVKPTICILHLLCITYIFFLHDEKIHTNLSTQSYPTQSCFLHF